ncbi:MAG: B12-binding domain-containing protein [Promethearchaeota archaeon]
MPNELDASLTELNEEAVLSWVEKEIQEGQKPQQIIEKLREGMSEIGRKFERHEVFLTHLMISASIFTKAMDLIKPILEAKSSSIEGLVAIGTPKGDIHDIGKNILISLLQVEGIETIDLGVDVSSDKFVRIIEEKKPRILALSALVTPTIYSMKEVIDEIMKSGLRDQITIVIGGGAVNETVVEFVGADAYAPDAYSGVNLIKELLKEGGK